jgi:hypothetical protein
MVGDCDIIDIYGASLGKDAIRNASDGPIQQLQGTFKPLSVDGAAEVPDVTTMCYQQRSIVRLEHIQLDYHIHQ